MTTAIEPKQVPTLRERIYAPSYLDQLRNALPRGLTPQAVARQALTLIAKNPKLGECTPGSVLAGIMEAAQLGLELTGPLGHAYLIPRRNSKLGGHEATFQVGYKGLIALAQRSEKICQMPARVAYANDHFVVELGTANKIQHTWQGTDRGEPIAWYALAYYQNGGCDFEVMSEEEMQAHRLKYSPPGKGPGPWDTEYPAMAKKTVIKRLCARLSMAPHAQKAAYMDDCYERGIDPYSPRGSQAQIGVSRSREVLEHLDAAAGQGEQVEGAAPDGAQAAEGVQ